MNQTQTIQTGTMDRPKRSKTIRNISESFWSKVNVSSDGCWMWAAAVGKNKYGRFGYKRKSYDAHRLAYQLANGPVPAGMVVRHSCDVPRCVRPDHLLIGTYKDNSQDAIDRNRGVGKHDGAGIKNPAARLNNEQVIEIRTLKGKCPAKVPARQYGVTPSMIWRIWKGLAWTHI